VDFKNQKQKNKSISTKPDLKRNTCTSLLPAHVLINGRNTYKFLVMRV